MDFSGRSSNISGLKQNKYSIYIQPGDRGGSCLADVLAGSINAPAVAGLLEVAVAVVGVVCVCRCEAYVWGYGLEVVDRGI